MNFFYLRHHYLSIVRGKSFGGEVVALILLVLLAGSRVPFFYDKLDDYATGLGKILENEAKSYELFLLLYFILDLAIRVIIKLPHPKVGYYLFWTDRTKSISWQYLITSLFGIIPVILFIPQLTLVIKTNEWLGYESSLAILGLFLFNHYFGLFLQFSKTKTRRMLLLALAFFLALLIYKVVSIAFILAVFLTIKMAFPLIVFVLVGAYYSVNSRLKERKYDQEKSTFSFFRFLPSANFKNPLFQLECSLISRNKRTRSNLLMGMLSLLLFSFLIVDKSSEVLNWGLFFMGTAFFIIGHGVYSLGWEGGYFDFLLTNISLNNFIKNRYLFYVGTCVLGFLLMLIPVMVKGLDLISLINMTVYNIGVTIPFALYRSVFNSNKIDLSENSFMNYNGMLTGPIFLTTIFLMILPVFFYKIGYALLGNNAVYMLGLVGLVGLLLNPLLLRVIVKSFSRRKYHLSQSFKS